MKTLRYLFALLAVLVTASLLTASTAYATRSTPISSLWCFRQDPGQAIAGTLIGDTGGPAQGKLTSVDYEPTLIGINGDYVGDLHFNPVSAATVSGKTVCEDCEVRLSDSKVYQGWLVMELVGKGLPGTHVGTARSISGQGTLRNVHFVMTWWDDDQVSAWCGARPDRYIAVGGRYVGEIHVDPAK